mgnify:CR=1 FL=1
MIFTWILAGAAIGIGLAYAIINWQDIKDWAMRKFENLKSSIRKAIVKLRIRGEQLIETLFWNEDGDIYTQDGPIRKMTEEEKRKAVQNGELDESDLKMLESKNKTVAEIDR